MKCMFCGCQDSKVVDSRAVEETNSIRRRRECLNCGKRFTTYENIEETPIWVIKNDNSRQPFDINKIKNGIMKACEKRPIPINEIDNMVYEIEKQVQNSLNQEVKSSVIGELVMEKLKKLDEIAYVRYAAVYRKFKDITSFMEFVNEFEDFTKNKPQIKEFRILIK